LSLNSKPDDLLLTCTKEQVRLYQTVAHAVRQWRHTRSEGRRTRTAGRRRWCMQHRAAGRTSWPSSRKCDVVSLSCWLLAISAVLRLHVVRLSVRLSTLSAMSLCLSVTLVDQDHICWKSWKLIAWTISPTPSLFVA